MSDKVITRFAPSPTGYLHVGGARTALFNYLFARKYGGVFRLRIEDTDRMRSSPEMTQKILDGLSWLGLDYDGELVFQGARANIHRKIAYRLLESKSAYRCFCSKEVLDNKRKEVESKGETYRYDQTCRYLSQEQIEANLAQKKPFAIRFRVPEGETSWVDGVRGRIIVRNQELDDFVILRSDGSPVYQLAVVVDDHDMGITHVIRGDDHLSNTPKQILIYRALGWEIPHFSHLPLILGQDKKRLSKRHGASSVEEYRDMGILPEALFNFLSLLGWNPGNDTEIMSREEIIQQFSLEGINKKSAIFDPAKLRWMNRQYISRKSDDELWSQVVEKWVKAGYLTKEEAESERHRLLWIISLLKYRVDNMNDFVESAQYFFQDPEFYDEKGIRKHLKNPEVWNWLEVVVVRLRELGKFKTDTIERVIRSEAEKFGVAAAKLIHPIRLALTGSTASPGLFEVMEILGKDVVLRRLNNLISKKKQLLMKIEGSLE